MLKTLELVASTAAAFFEHEQSAQQHINDFRAFIWPCDGGAPDQERACRSVSWTSRLLEFKRSQLLASHL